MNKNSIVIKRLFLNERLYLKIGRDVADPEKLVFPSILFISTNHESFGDLRRKGCMICVGWWDFSIKFGMFL